MFFWGVKMIGPIALTSVSEFFETLIYGQGIWLYLVLILGVLFVVSFKVKYFSLVSMFVCIFMGIEYLGYGSDNSVYMPQILLLFVINSLWLWLFWKDLKG